MAPSQHIDLSLCHLNAVSLYATLAQQNIIGSTFRVCWNHNCYFNCKLYLIKGYN